MKTQPIPMFDKNDEILAITFGKIYAIMLNPKRSTRAQRILAKIELDQLFLHLISAPEFMLPSC